MPVENSLKARRQKLFRNGGSQAVRIPKEMKFDTDEVILHREENRLIIQPRLKKISALSKQMGNPLDWNWEAPDNPVQPDKFY